MKLTEIIKAVSIFAALAILASLAMNQFGCTRTIESDNRTDSPSKESGNLLPPDPSLSFSNGIDVVDFSIWATIADSLGFLDMTHGSIERRERAIEWFERIDNSLRRTGSLLPDSTINYLSQFSAGAEARGYLIGLGFVATPFTFTDSTGAPYTVELPVLTSLAIIDKQTRRINPVWTK